jgi:hypothetical protein
LPVAAAVARPSEADFYPLVAAALILIGVALRVTAFVDARPLWLDEAMLALNVAARSYGDLVRPLGLDQAAPPGFLWLQRLAVDLGGVSEYSLRFAPFAAGIATLLLIWPVGRRLIGERNAVLATGIVALQLGFTHYATEAKPYGVDAFVTIGLLGLLVSVAARPHSRARWGALGGGGVLAVTLSHPAVFVLPGIAGALLVDRRTRGISVVNRRVLMLCVMWGVAFGLTFLFFYTRSAGDAYLTRYWEGSYLMRALASERFWLRAIVFSSGVAALVYHRRHMAAAVCAVPILVYGAATAAEAYPLTTRLTMFLAPLSALAYASAAGWLIGRLGARARLAVLAVLLAVVSARQLYSAPRFITVSMNREDHRDLVQRITRDRRGEPVFMNGFAAPAWAFYTTDWAAPDTARLRWFFDVLSWGGSAFPNSPPRGHPVVNEGSELRYAAPDGLEIVGVPTGMEYRNATRYTQDAPDAGWSENEIARIRAAATPFAWIFLSHYAPVQESALLAALESAGGRIIESETRRGAAVHRVCLPRRATSSGAGDVVNAADLLMCRRAARAAVALP